MLDGEYQFPCGCWATRGGPYWGYEIDDDEHTCNGAYLKSPERQERREKKRESAIASYKRSTTPLRSPVPFSILKPTNKNRW